MAVRPGWAQSEQVMAMAFFTDGALEPAALHDRGAACARAACGWRRGGGGGVGARPLRVRLHAQLSVDFVPKTAAAVRALCAVTVLGVIVLMMADGDAAAPPAARALRARSLAGALASTLAPTALFDDKAAVAKATALARAAGTET